MFDIKWSVSLSSYRGDVIKSSGKECQFALLKILFEFEQVYFIFMYFVTHISHPWAFEKKVALAEAAYVLNWSPRPFKVRSVSLVGSQDEHLSE